MSFELFGFDIIPELKLHGVWFCSVTTMHVTRNLFSVYYDDGDWKIDFLFFRYIYWEGR